MLDPRFKYVGTCSCDGTSTKKYQYGSWLIYISAKYFRVKKNGSTVKSKTPLSELETYLSQAIPAIPVR